MSAGPTIAFGRPIVAPAEPRETPSGPLAFVLDSGSQSLYEYDAGRHRFLGPAPRVDDGHEVIDLPGYPTVVGRQPPQQAVLCGDVVAVAGGNDGTVVEVPVTPSGLGNPIALKVPAVTVRRSAVKGGGLGSDADSRGVPFIAYIVPLAGWKALAVTHGSASGVAVGYLVDLTSHAVTAAAQLGSADSAAVTTYHGSALVAMSDGSLAVVDSRLGVSHARLPIPTGSNLWDMASSDQAVFLSTGVFSSHVGNGRAEVISYRLGGDGNHVVATDADPVGGSITTGNGSMLWARPDAKRIDQIDLQSKVTASWHTCAPNSVTWWHSEILVTCVGPGELDVVDTSNGHVSRQFAGGFPVDVIASSD